MFSTVRLCLRSYLYDNTCRPNVKGNFAKSSEKVVAALEWQSLVYWAFAHTHYLLVVLDLFVLLLLLELFGLFGLLKPRTVSGPTFGGSRRPVWP